ncbi:G2/M phase-specific E3 ubiquitin-protein ligase-like [Cyprinodon tularosa]|uniref:G2/M phase-specific E3 ubiquitin-protein ligase-like n=1 Tax=Cyprinodon tularosa TaxID=77115 RepID=UPI0018E1ED69|nr:G2/M phase-specific E3 ubiquitin-protein ligase-like [Cyprinodon tularosa]
MDDFMQAKGSVDEGGPSREFFRLLLMAMKDSMLFTGPQNSKNLSLNSQALHRSLYKTYDVITVALVHGGVRPSFFSERLYKNLCLKPTSPPTLEEVVDQDLHLKLKKISEASDLTEARAAIEEAAERLSLLGSLRHITTLEGWDLLVQATARFYVEGRTKEALQHVWIRLTFLFLRGAQLPDSLVDEAFCESGGAVSDEWNWVEFVQRRSIEVHKQE